MIKLINSEFENKEIRLNELDKLFKNVIENIII